MLHERIFLDKDNPQVYIDTYVPTNASILRPAMLVIPGGGYSNVCHLREGEPVALAYVARGYSAFVLNYRTGDGVRYPEHLIDASRAIVHIRDNAEKYSIDPHRVYAVGFSAGGHLAGSLAIMHAEDEVLKRVNVERGYNRPDAVVLSYPVASAVTPRHSGSFARLAGKPFDEIDEEQRRFLSLECRADAESAPAFIWHTAKDSAVPVQGSLALMQRYVELGLVATLRIYPYGPHGIALADETTSDGNDDYVQPLAQEWVDESVAFLNTL